MYLSVNTRNKGPLCGPFFKFNKIWGENFANFKEKPWVSKDSKKGKWANASLINVYIDRNQLNKNYVGIAVGKKVSKSSVKRNRIKRLMREAYRLNEHNIERGFNIVIIWKTSCGFELANFRDIQRDLIYSFKKAGIQNTDENE